MNTDAPSSEPAAPAERASSTSAPAAARATAPKPKPPVAARGTRGGALAFAVMLALLAAAASGYVGWQQWQQGRDRVSAAKSVAALDGRIATVEATMKTLDDERRSLRDRLRDADDVNRGMREELLGQNERLRNLEDAVAKLSEKSLSGHDAMLLDETESLLRMGKERYTLFHDAAGAAIAYALADQTLAGVGDAAFSGLRQSVGAEHDALAANEAAHPEQALQQLQQLRDGVAHWPLRPLDTPSVGTAGDTWSRIRGALASVVSIERDNGAPLAVADARLTRELAALDLAHAEAALLAHDPDAYIAALKRVDSVLSAQFDPASDAIKQARGTLSTLIGSASAAKPVQLGAALAELRNLRSVHALKPSSPAAAPSSSSGPAPAPASARSSGATP